MRVLYVEDHEDLRELTVEILAEWQLDFEAVDSAEAALAAFQRQPFDLLLTDVSLPGVLGTALAKQLMSRHPALRVVFLSGYDLGLLTDWGPQVSAMVKPVDDDALKARLDEVRRGLQT
ncbi:MAG: response regulator [Rubrivivax sp.]